MLELSQFKSLINHFYASFFKNQVFIPELIGLIYEYFLPIGFHPTIKATTCILRNKYECTLKPYRLGLVALNSVINVSNKQNEKNPVVTMKI